MYGRCHDVVLSQCFDDNAEQIRLLGLLCERLEEGSRAHILHYNVIITYITTNQSQLRGMLDARCSDFRQLEPLDEMFTRYRIPQKPFSYHSSYLFLRNIYISFFINSQLSSAFLSLSSKHWSVRFIINKQKISQSNKSVCIMRAPVCHPLPAHMHDTDWSVCIILASDWLWSALTLTDDQAGGVTYDVG